MTSSIPTPPPPAVRAEAAAMTGRYARAMAAKATTDEDREAWEAEARNAEANAERIAKQTR